MNTVDITTSGPVMENLNHVTVSDGYADSTVHLDHADVEAAKAEGHAAVISLILDNGCGYDILNGAVGNGSPVILDGENVSAEDLAKAMEDPAAAPSA